MEDGNPRWKKIIYMASARVAFPGPSFRCGEFSGASEIVYTPSANFISKHLEYVGAGNQAGCMIVCVMGIFRQIRIRTSNNRFLRFSIFERVVESITIFNSAWGI
jgi:hypothetical protein